MPLTQVCAHARFHMKLQVVERVAAITIMEVSDPTTEGCVDVFYYHVKRLLSMVI